MARFHLVRDCRKAAFREGKSLIPKSRLTDAHLTWAAVVIAAFYLLVSTRHSKVQWMVWYVFSPFQTTRIL